MITELRNEIEVLRAQLRVKDARIAELEEVVNRLLPIEASKPPRRPKTPNDCAKCGSGNCYCEIAANE